MLRRFLHHGPAFATNPLGRSDFRPLYPLHVKEVNIIFESMKLQVKDGEIVEKEPGKGPPRDDPEGFSFQCLRYSVKKFVRSGLLYGSVDEISLSYEAARETWAIPIAGTMYRRGMWFSSIHIPIERLYGTGRRLLVGQLCCVFSYRRRWEESADFENFQSQHGDGDPMLGDRSFELPKNWLMTIVSSTVRSWIAIRDVETSRTMTVTQHGMTRKRLVSSSKLNIVRAASPIIISRSSPRTSRKTHLVNVGWASKVARRYQKGDQQS